jgi:helicase
LNDSGKKQREDIVEISRSLNIPLDVLKKNKYVPFDNQLALITILRNEPNLKDDLHFDKNLPSKQQVDIIIKLVHEVLFSDYERKRSWTTNNIARFVKSQLYFKPSLKSLIKQYDAVNEDTKIRNVLSLIYTYFEFSLPKYIMTLENLYNYVYEGDLSFSIMITHLQYGSNEIQDILLADAGLPKTIIQYLSPKLKGIKSVDDIRNRIHNNPTILNGLSKLEVKMLSMRI